jgi:hypothetical protein
VSRGLRYLTEADMPEGMRRAVSKAALRKGAAAKVSARAMKRSNPRRVQKEHNEQVVLFNRIAALAVNDPRYALAAKRTFAIPNGGKRSRGEAGKLKAEGVKAGVSDVFCALPVGAKHGLFLEMKALDGAAPSGDQRGWLDDSNELGYVGAWARGADAAMQVWLDYLSDAIRCAWANSRPRFWRTPRKRTPTPSGWRASFRPN